MPRDTVVSAFPEPKKARKNKTVRIETNVSEFGGNFFSQPDRPSFFQSLGDENRKTKIRHTETRGNDGGQRRWPNSLPAASRTPILSTKIVPHAKGYRAVVLGAVVGRQNWGRKNTKKSCDGLTLAKNEFWRRAKSSLTSPARCFAFYDGTDREMGGRHFQRWVGCNFDLIKICGDLSSVYRFPPNSETFVSIRTVLCVPTWCLLW